MKKQYFKWMFSLALLCCSFTMQSQEITIAGKVTSASDGEPLPGVNVINLGTKNGSTTGFEGDYSIKAKKGDVLEFSYIGMKTVAISVNEKTIINVLLQEDASELDEVIVVGYGKQRKIDITGSVSSISSKEITRAPAANLANSLAGKLTGVISTQRSGQPGFDSPSFLIRGASSFGDNSPLILVDGIVRSFSRVNPNEIANVTILKDAASTAVYGARAANGVILITTKRGSSNQSSFEYTSTYSWQTPTIRPEFMNSGEYSEYINIARLNDGDNPKYTPEEVQAFKNGTAPNTDWWDETVNGKGITEQHNLSVNGGNEKTKYFLSFGYLNQEGLLKTSNFNTYSVRSNIDNKISDRVTLSVDLAGRKESRLQSALGPAEVFKHIDQSLPTVPATFPEIGEGALGWNGLNGSPVVDSDYSGKDTRVYNIFQSNFKLKYDFEKIDGLSATGMFSYDHTSRENKKFILPYTYYSQDRVTGVISAHESRPKIELDESRNKTIQKTLRFSLNYDKAWGDHNISALALYEQTEGEYDYISAYRDGFISPSIDQIFAGGLDNLKNGGSASINARKGYVGRVNYNYAGKYLLQANARYDASFNFHKDKRWGVFPAFSAGWVISKEDFLTNVDFIDNLKLRASWGQVGNDRVPQFQFLSGFKFNGGYVIGNGYQKGIFDNKPPNVLITWETATSTNIGFDFSLFNGQLTGEFDYFTKRTKDILRPNTAATPSTFGSSLPDENFAVVDNHGIELVLGHRKSVGDFSYNLNLNGTFVTSEVIDMREPEDVEDRIRKTGRPFSQRYGLIAEGLFQSQSEIDNWADQDGNSNKSIQPGDIRYRDINDDGVVDGFDVTHIGKSETPELIYGFNAGASYKGFDLNLMFQGASRFQRYVFVDPFALESNSEKILKDSWSPENTDAAYPRLSIGQTNNNAKGSTFWLKDASYLRLKNIELAYTLPEIESITDLGINKLRFYLSGSNLLTFSKIKNRDPEGPSGRVTFYPQTKSLLVGVNVQF